jgi:hypothetical protein
VVASLDADACVAEKSRKDPINPRHESGQHKLKGRQSPLVTCLDSIEGSRREALTNAAVVHAQTLRRFMRRQAGPTKDRVLERRSRNRVLEAELKAIELETASPEQLNLFRFSVPCADPDREAENRSRRARLPWPAHAMEVLTSSPHRFARLLPPFAAAVKS